MKYSVLEKWKSDYYKLTSPLAIDKSEYIDRDNIDFIFETFLNFFSPNYFLVNGSKFLPNNDTSFSDNSVHQLLDQRGLSSFFMLLDIACLLSFSERLTPEVRTNLRSLINKPDRLRDKLFEVFTMRFFIRNGINVIPNPKFAGKEVDGFFKLDDINCTIECRKLYSIENNRLTFLKWAHHEFIKNWLKFQPEIIAFIISPNKDENDLRRDKQSVIKGIREYFLKTKAEKNYNFLFENNNDKGQRILHFEKRNQGIFEHYPQLIKDPFYYFSVYRQPYFSTKELNKQQFVYGFNMTMSIEDLNKKLLDIIKEKDKQHIKNIGNNHYRFFFFENEIPAFAEVPLLPPKQWDNLDLKTFLNSRPENNFICIFNKRFFNDRPSEFSLKIFCKDELEEVKNRLTSYIIGAFSF